LTNTQTKREGSTPSRLDQGSVPAQPDKPAGKSLDRTKSKKGPRG